jgi:uncharacterized protein (TIGR02145 family)
MISCLKNDNSNKNLDPPVLAPPIKNYKFNTPKSSAINLPKPNLTDIDGNTYQSISICDQIWTKTNLNVSKYSDGTPIPQVQDPNQWNNLITGAWCYYNDDPNNGDVYGKLYNWYAVAGIHDEASYDDPSLRKNLAPQGWHIPNDSEWGTLINCLDPSANGDKHHRNKAGSKLKATNSCWQRPNTDASNESGFTGLPGGFRSNISGFNNLGTDGYWWSSSEAGNRCVWWFNINCEDGSAYLVLNNSMYKSFGISVRCVKN